MKQASSHLTHRTSECDYVTTLRIVMPPSLWPVDGWDQHHTDLYKRWGFFWEVVTLLSSPVVHSCYPCCGPLPQWPSKDSVALIREGMMQKMLLRTAEVILCVLGRELIKLTGPLQGLWSTGNAFRIIWIISLLKSKCSLGFGSARVASMWNTHLLFLINLHLLTNYQMACVSV